MRQTIVYRISLALAMALPLAGMAQREKLSYGAPEYWRPYDQTGINVFETGKIADTTGAGQLKVRFGAGFTQQFQNLKHENFGGTRSKAGS
jgi:hypothetical protein